MKSFYRNNAIYRGLGAGMFACLLFFFAASPCSAMIRKNIVTDYGANGVDNLDDSAAFQTAIDDARKSSPIGGYIYIPNGTYDFDSVVSKQDLSLPGFQLTIQGQSRTGVVLRCNNTNGIISIYSDNRGSHMILRDLTLQANIAGAGTAYAATSREPGGLNVGRQQQVFNVDITYANTNCYFNNGLNLFGANRALVSGCTINSPTNSDMSDSSINFRMQKAINFDATYNGVVRNTVINGADTALSVAMVTCSTEGGTVFNCNFDYVKTAISYTVEGDGRAGMEIRYNNIKARDCGIFLRNRSIFFLAENTFRQLSTNYPLKDLSFENAASGFIVRNTFDGALAGGRTNIVAGSCTRDGITYYSRDIIIGKNKLSGAVDDAITSELGSYDIIITGNNDLTGPVFVTNSFTKADATAEYAYSGSISNAAVDADGDTLTFCKADGPEWLQVSPSGKLSGIPGTNDVGTNVFTVRVIDNGGLHNDATMTITVASPSSLPPVWPGLATFISVSNEDGMVTESAQGSGVGDLVNSTSAASGGMRLGDNASNAQYRVFLSFDTSTLPGDATVTSATLKLNRSAVVGTNPFTWGGSALADIKGGFGFSGSTALQAGDFEAAADASAVTAMSSPAANGNWSTGTLSSNALQYVNRIGTTQLRVYMTTASLTNGAVDYMGFWPGDATNQTYRPVFEVGYLRPNNAPVWSTNLLITADATEAAVYSGSLAANAADSDVGDALTFSIVSGPAWLMVTTNGVLSGTPHNADVGTNTFVVRVTDTQTAAADAMLKITVINVNGAPEWSVNPFDKSEVAEDTAYSDSIATDAFDADAGDTATFSKVSGPAWLSVAANGALSGTPGNDNVGLNTFVVHVTDALGLSSNATMNITVLNVNDAPVANDQNASTAEDTATNLVLTGSDIDSANLTYAVLDNPVHGVLSGLDPVSGAVIYTPALDYNGADSFTFTVSDGDLSAIGTVSLSVTAVNDAPAANSQSSTALEDTATNLVLSATDIDSTNLTYAVLANPAHGILSGLNPATGAVTYTPSADYAGSDYFAFTVSDGMLSATGTVSLTVTAVNDAPVANSQNPTVLEDVATNLVLTATDIDSTNLTYAVLANPSHGALSGLNPVSGAVTYTPVADYYGADSFTFTVSDGALSSTGTVSLTVVPGVPAPWLTQDVGSGHAEGMASESNCVFTASGCGTIAGTNDDFRFVYRIWNGNGEIRARIPSFQAGATAQYGVMMRDSLTTDSKMVYMGVSGAGSYASKCRATTGAQYANTLAGTNIAPDMVWVRLVRIGDSVVSYKSPDGTAWTAVNTSTVVMATNCYVGLCVGYNSTNVLRTGTFDNVTVAAVNVAPVANDQSASTPEDTMDNLVLTATDIDSTNLTYAVLANPAHGALSGLNPNTGAISYTPAANYTGADSFTFTVSDGSLSATGTVSLTVSAVNDAPVANSQSPSAVEDTATNLVLTATDIDSTNLTYAVLANPSHGALSGLNPDTGTITYTPTANYNGADSFTFTVSDGVLSATGTVSLTVTAVNDAPVANSQSPAAVEDVATNLVLTASDIDSTNLTYAVLDNPVHGVLSGLDPVSGAVIYTPALDYNGADSFTFTVSDGDLSAIGTVSLSVTAVNDAPVANSQSPTALEDVATNLVLTASDIDSTNLTYAVLANPAHGALSGLNPNTGAISYTPAANYNGADSFTFTVSDGSLSATGTVSLTVSAVNDAPVANSQSPSAVEDTATNLVLTATDIDSTNLTYAVLANPAHGALSGLDPVSGAVIYTPALDYNGADSFTFTVSDGVLSATGTVSLTVSAVNDAPAANSQNVNATQNTATNLVLTASDIDSTNLTYAALASPGHGSLSGLDPVSGAITYTPATNYYGADSFTFTVSDGSLSATGTVSITVAQVIIPSTVTLTSPTNNAVYTLPVNITLSATVATNGNTINKVQFYYNATNLIGEVTDAPYTYAWTNAVRGSYTITARLTYNTSSTTNSSAANITILGLPSPWLTADIGTGLVAGSASESNGVYTVKGAGTVGGTADKYRFVYQTLSGNGEIKLRIPTFQTGSNARIGIMMRDTLTTGSRMSFMGINGSGSYYNLRRTSTGGTASSTSSGSGTAPNIWVRLVRTGNSVAAYKSTNGTSWTSVNTTTVTMATNCYFGICVSSGATNTLNSSTFDTLTVTP